MQSDSFIQPIAPPASLAFYLPLKSDPKPLVLVRRYNTLLQITLDDQVAPNHPHAMLRIPVSQRSVLLVDYSDDIAPQQLEPQFLELQRHLLLAGVGPESSFSLGPLACARATWLMRTNALSAEAAISQSAKQSMLLLEQERARQQDIFRLHQWGRPGSAS